MAELDTPDMKDKDNYKNISHKTDLTDNGYAFGGAMAGDCEIQPKSLRDRIERTAQQGQWDQTLRLAREACDTIDRQAEQLKALEKNLHEECASSAQTITLLQEKVEARDKALLRIVGICDGPCEISAIAQEALKG